MSFLDHLANPDFIAQQDQYNRHLAAKLVAIQMALFRAGVTTPKEFERDAAAHLAAVDQMVAEKKEEIDQKFREQYPNTAAILESLFGNKGDEP